MSSHYILGLDTSNYTTSICLIDEQGKIVHEARRLLKVPEGERGLQQSAALFQHVQNIPELFADISPFSHHVKAVAVSKKPRPSENSYMPVFLAGTAIATALAKSCGVPLIETTHQEGHIAAGEGTTGEIAAERFLAIHISGGTTDLLVVERQETGYKIAELGSSRDLHAGQFVDRIGVALGLPFPAGPHLEQLARKSEILSNGSAKEQNGPEFFLASPVNGYEMSFSGAETKAVRAIENGVDGAAVARAVENCIAKGIEKVLTKALEELQLKHALIVGGVAANQWIRKRLSKRLQHPAVGMKLYFALPKYSTDNAFGVARIGLNWYIKTIGTSKLL